MVQWGMREGAGAAYSSGYYSSGQNSAGQYSSGQHSNAHGVVPHVSEQPAPVHSANAMRDELGQYFFGLRGALGLTAIEAARLLNTTPDVIAALERGVVELLPPWPQTVALVRNYAALACVDGEPSLHWIAAVMQASSSSYTAGNLPPPAAARPSMASRHSPARRSSSAGRPANGRPAPLVRMAKLMPKRTLRSVRRRPARALYATVLPALVVIAALSPSAVARVAAPLQSVVIAVGDQVRVVLAPIHDGHRWIETSDPRQRRGDKLQINRRSG